MDNSRNKMIPMGRIEGRQSARAIQKRRKLVPSTS
jgi:hypothetical protein